jgi:hypothetical protein
MNKIILILFVALLTFACQSPLDVDTARTKNSLVTIKTPYAAGEFSVEQNGVVQTFNIVNAAIWIDTNKSPNVIWLEISLINQLSPNESSGLFVKKIDFALDSLPISVTPFTITNGYSLGLRGRGGAKFQVWRGSSATDTVIESGWNRNYSEIYFSQNSSKTELWAYLNSKIYENRINIGFEDSTYTSPTTGEDTTVTVSKQYETKDSLFLNGKFQILLP